MIIFLVFGYFWYSRITDKPIDTETFLFTQEQVLGSEFIAIVKKIRTIKLDTSFFEKESFRSLKDLIPEVEKPEKVGRKNPFLPMEQN